MSVQNFNPILWAKKIAKELDNEHYLVKNCTTSWSGEISGVGSKVKITDKFGAYGKFENFFEEDSTRDWKVEVGTKYKF